MNITIDDRSPQLQFVSLQPYTNNTPGWIDNHNGPLYPDTFTNSYFDDTFTAGFDVGDYMQFRFNGTAIYVYGSKRFNHGSYSAQLDGGEVLTQSGYAPGNSEFQQLLYSAGGLSPSTEHNLVMTNAANVSTNPNVTWFDIDYVIVTANLNTNSSASSSSSNASLTYTTYYDDTSPYAAYTGTGWSTGPPLQPQTYYNDTAHITNHIGDAMTLAFNGSSIELFGGLYLDHGNYSISLDGVAQPFSFNGTFFQLEVRTSLFLATELEEGPHTITLACSSKGPVNSFLDFDYAVANSSINPNLSSGSSNSTGTNSTTAPVGSSAPSAGSSGGNSADVATHSNAGAIAGGVVGGVVGLALILFLLWFFLFRKRRNHHRELNGEKSVRPIDLNGDEVAPYHSPELGNGSSFGGSQNGISSRSPEMGQMAFPAFNVPAPPGSNATSYPRSQAPPSTMGGTAPVITESELGYPYLNPFTASTNPPSAAGDAPALEVGERNASGGTNSNANSNSGSGTSGTTPTISQAQSSAKAAALALPFTARTPSNPVNSDNNSSPQSARMQVDGRAVDAGPVELPPNYEQATEPLPGQRPTAS